MTRAEPAPLLAGVDGCRGGWVVVTASAHPARPTGATVEVVASFAEVAARGHAVIAVDMPIGLPAAGPRACDVAARRVVGPRRSSVFPAPVRAVLDAGSYPDALERSRRSSGRGLSKQAWNLVRRIAEVDAVVRAEGQARIHEAHPESAFVALAGEFLPPKRSEAGARRRWALLREALPELFGQGGPGRAGDGDGENDRPRPPRGAGADDVADAAVLLWTARRLYRGEAVVLGDDERDPVGLAMRIAY